VWCGVLVSESESLLGLYSFSFSIFMCHFRKCYVSFDCIFCSCFSFRVFEGGDRVLKK